MWKSTVLLLCLIGYCCAGPVISKRNMPIMQRDDEPTAMETSDPSEDVKPEDPAAHELPLMSTLTLPSNATSIRADITDNFSCEDKPYGYYADMENDCQIFHVCLPVTYADGKENTFRWSFICPEETVFSQESFTCLRSEDMTIDCEESFKYYELNRNFGMIEEEPVKNTHTLKEPMKMQNEPETAMSAIQVVEVKQPLEEQPMPALTQSIKEPKKPIKEIKKPMPNRRKPSQTATTTNKKKSPTPAAQPLRKAEKPTEKPMESTPIEETVAVVEKEIVKPSSNQRYTKRPTTMSTAVKDKMQSPKPQTQAAPNRGDLFNQIRKRPTITNKKDATVVVKLAEEEKPEETVAVRKSALEDPDPTLKIETLFTPVPVVASEPLAPAGTVPNPVEEAAAETIAVPENEAAASEAIEVFAKPVEEEKITPETAAEVKPEVQAAIDVLHQTKATESASEPIASPVEDEKEIIEASEIVPSEEEATEIKKIIEALTSATPQAPVESVEPTLTVAQNSLAESPKVEVATKPIEAIEEIPAVILEAEEQQPGVVELNQAQEEAATKLKLNSNEATKKVPEEIPAESVIVPDGTTSDVLTPSLEELEDAKPADAIEVLEASPDMLVQDPVVQDMFPDTKNSLKESSGGFKPVDPVMAAEAEALITDFLHTLMKSDNSNNKPIYPGESHLESADTIEAKPEANRDEQNQPIPAESESEAEAEADAEKLKNGAAFSNVLMPISLPDSMYQIPVQVVTSPVETEEVKIVQDANANQGDSSVEENKVETDTPENNAVPSQGEKTRPAEKAVEPAQQSVNEPQVAETNQPIETEAAAMSSYEPLSIDDVVELVKERLDQVPTESETATEVVSVENAKTSGTPSEEIIMPIYHRVNPIAAEPSLLQAQSLFVNEPTPVEKNLESSTRLQEEEHTKPQAEISIATVQPNEAEQIEKTDAQAPETQETKQSRSFRSRSMKNAKMDPRKRRFLFRSDAS